MTLLRRGDPVLSMHDVIQRYGRGPDSVTALDHVTLEAHAGELLLLEGQSGSGKTTCLTVMAGLLRPTSGTVSIFGLTFEERSTSERQRLRCRRMGFLFQGFLLLDDLTAVENVALVLRFRGVRRQDARLRAQEALIGMGVGPLADRRPPGMSPGERQRVALARALVNEPDVLFADEPTASLERDQGAAVIEVLERHAHTGGRCVVVASHDRRFAKVADQVARLEHGALCSAAPATSSDRDALPSCASEHRS